MPLLSHRPNVIALKVTVRRAEDRLPAIDRTRYPPYRCSKPEQIRTVLGLRADFGHVVSVRIRSPVGPRICRYYPRRPYGPACSPPAAYTEAIWRPSVPAPSITTGH